MNSIPCHRCAAAAAIAAPSAACRIDVGAPAGPPVTDEPTHNAKEKAHPEREWANASECRLTGLFLQVGCLDPTSVGVDRRLDRHCDDVRARSRPQQETRPSKASRQERMQPARPVRPPSSGGMAWSSGIVGRPGRRPPTFEWWRATQGCPRTIEIASFAFLCRERMFGR